ncbi:hypothetical protein HT102_11615 [Hoyosella sp. G463]|uniref:Oxo-4-hydroxy-4-carboxy-5-ureidoimidazoline decarboxylase domain-containing protein n=1 Tax=Lolliginicoccus lacisalsi TaxID=2742202 RepID=A0A927JEI6_9ACTN|nr:2-oxo-4-hydroxy-4-carboxy-5-ureidoimidazoline decarboxylase [Lolliginicoccus lacisalsi]MBD8507137.1 hypothetical protein [Lolliginicoccus lacisalsi]
MAVSFPGAPRQRGLVSRETLGQYCLFRQVTCPLSRRCAGSVRVLLVKAPDAQKLATVYRMRSGFPLIIRAREIEHFDAVLRAGASRLDNQPASERAFALVEVAKILN